MKSLAIAAACATLSLASSGCTQEQKTALRNVFPDEPLLNQPSKDPRAIAAAHTPPGLAAATTRPAPAPPQVVEVTFPASGGAGNNRSADDNADSLGNIYIYERWMGTGPADIDNGSPDPDNP